WWAVLAFLICAIPGGVLTWYLYWGGRWLATPLSNYLFKNPVAPKKRLIDGLTVRASYSLVVLTLMALPFYAFLTADFSHLPNTDPAVPLQYKMLIALHTYSGQVFLAALGLWIFITHRLKRHPGLFIWIAKLTRQFPRDDARRSWRGDGGDAQFAGFWKEHDYPWIPGTLLLGQSLYGKHWIGYKDIKKNESDDRHIVTLAGSRAGKGISRIIPNLLLWQDNAIIIDPKGENATVTAQNPIRSQAFVIDPYGMVKNVFPRGKAPSSAPVPPIRAKYNVMLDLDRYSPMIAEQITVVTNAIVLPESDKNKYFEDQCKIIIRGVIGHVLTSPSYEGMRSLVTVYRLLNSASVQELGTLYEAMRQNAELGDIISEGANALASAVAQANQNVLSTVRRNLNWLSFKKVQELVGGGSDFSMYDIANKPISIYLCFDMEALENLNRFVRLFFLMAFHAMTHPRGAKTKKVLFLMDEFFTLGYLPMLEKGAQYIAGEGVKLWPIIQNIAMIESLYGKTWTNFIEAAGVIEAFGLSAGDREGTAHWVHEKLGTSRSSKLKMGDAAKSMETLPLMTQSELEQEFSRESDRSIVFFKGTDPLVLRRKPYWELFHPLMYTNPPQSVPSRNETGWTHHVYFGSNSKTLSAMGTPFDAEARIKAVKKYQSRAKLLLSSSQSPDGLYVPGPAIDEVET
ncbi:MAG: type IV secretory system conjugative DNA transfer family protein, partial [Planctomycetaceae bacterium]|nr:type IV secretory system conjugative DNA transfer family protein [Planctomycetaceae bacterium]